MGAGIVTTQREIRLEQYLIEQVQMRGGLCWKLAPLSAVGIPDRIILLPRGRVAFLELKRDGKEPTRVQAYWLNRLRNMGFRASWAASRERVNEFMAGMA